MEREETALPLGWVWTTVGEVADTTRARVEPQEHPSLRFIGMEHVEAHTMRLLDTVPASEMKSSAEHFWPGDVLYGRLRPYLNKILSPDFEGLCSSEFIIFRRTPHYDSRYLQYYLNTAAFVSFASLLNTGDRPRVKFDQLADYPFPLPPLPEQCRIVAKIEELLTDLDAGIAALKRAQARLKRYKAAVLKAACEGRLVPQDPNDEPAPKLLERILAERRARWEEEQRAKGKGPSKARYVEAELPDTDGLPELPEGWVWATTGQICDCIVPNRDKPKTFTGNIPWITLPDFDDSIKLYASKSGLGLSQDEIRQYRAKVIPKGSVVMSCIGRFGITAVLGQDAVVNQQLHAFLVPDQLEARYLAYAIKTQVSFMEIIATATTIAYLNKDNCNSVPIPLPPLPEQHRIVAEIERRLSVIATVEAAVEANLARAGRLRQSILKRAFEGKLVPQDPSDEPASTLLERIKAEKAGRETR